MIWRWSGFAAFFHGGAQSEPVGLSRGRFPRGRFGNSEWQTGTERQADPRFVKTLRSLTFGIRVGSSEISEVIMTKQLTAIIEREGDGYVALCPELDIASQGVPVAETRANLKEAVGYFSRRLQALKFSIGCMRISYIMLPDRGFKP